MPYQYEEELREKAHTFIQILRQAGIPVEPYPTLFRDYMAKLAVNGAGYISIYYSPKQQAFSLKLHELRDARLVPQIEACWQGDSINTDAADDPVVAALEQKALGFVAFLASQEIKAEYTQLYNQQYARIIVEQGFFDLYNTRKRPMSPYAHNFKDAALQKHIERLWQQFHAGVAEEIAVNEASGFEEVEYYLAIFAPYRHLAFDFSVLANALSKIVSHKSGIELSVDSYDALESLYRQLKDEQG